MLRCRDLADGEGPEGVATLSDYYGGTKVGKKKMNLDESRFIGDELGIGCTACDKWSATLGGLSIGQRAGA